MRSGRLAGYMSTYTKTPASFAFVPYGDSAVGSAGSSGSAADCNCHIVVRQNSELIALQHSDTALATDCAAAAIARARDIDWIGDAADMFRFRLDEAKQLITLLTDDVETTYRLALEVSS